MDDGVSTVDLYHRYLKNTPTRADVIIAIKGQPCTGKTRLASSLAHGMHLPLISLDDIRDCIATSLTIQNTTKVVAATNDDDDDDIILEDQCFEAVCQMSLHLRQLGFSIIIDSSLSQRAHLDKLLSLSTSTGATLVVAECKPRDRYQWQQWIEKRSAHDHEHHQYWYKPSNWNDLENLMERDGGSSDYDTQGVVSKIVVDTTRAFKLFNFIYALEYITSESPTGGGHHTIDLNGWIEKLEKQRDQRNDHEKVDKHIVKEEEVENSSDRRFGKFVHYHILALRNSEEENKYSEFLVCFGCMKPILGFDPVYYCDEECGLTLHQFCAELPNKKEMKPREYPPFLKGILHDNKYFFQEKVTCGFGNRPCGVDFDECPQCLFDSYIRSGELPSVLHHPCHEHPLQIIIIPLSLQSEFHCRACGETGKYIKYICYECDFDYHPACCFLPYKYKQDRHLHNLYITFLPEFADSQEEFLCDACETYRNPSHWIYYCSYCEFASHLSCMDYDLTDMAEREAPRCQTGNDHAINHSRIGASMTGKSAKRIHKPGSSTYKSRGLSTCCPACEQMWTSNNSGTNYYKLMNGEHIYS